MTSEERARQIVAYYKCIEPDTGPLETAITAALDAAKEEGRKEAKAPTGHVIDDKGVARPYKDSGEKSYNRSTGEIGIVYQFSAPRPAAEAAKGAGDDK